MRDAYIFLTFWKCFKNLIWRKLRLSSSVVTTYELLRMRIWRFAAFFSFSLFSDSHTVQLDCDCSMYLKP